MDLMNFDFQKANAQIREMEEISSSVGKLAGRDYANTMQQLSGAWKGAAAESYLRKAYRLQEKMQKTAEEIKRTAEIYNATVKRVAAAEEQAKAIASRRSR